jgi:hypothetical protein
MNAHPPRPDWKFDSAPALIDAATRAFGRIARVAIHATPTMRLRLQGELALTEIVLDTVERYVRRGARATLKAVPKRRALPPAKRRTT